MTSLASSYILKKVFRKKSYISYTTHRNPLYKKGISGVG